MAVASAPMGAAVADGSGEGVASSALGTEATLAFWEVLSYSQLLEDGGIEEAFLAALAKVGGSSWLDFSWVGSWPP